MAEQLRVKKPRKLDPEVIREGDRVTLVEPKAVARVGYPRSVQEYQAEVAQSYKTEIQALIAKVTAGKKRAFPRMIFDKVVSELGYGLAKADGFGGSKRDVFLRDLPATWVGLEGEVWEIKSVATGTREEGYYTPPSYDEMWGESVPPSFYTEKIWRLVRMSGLPMFEKASSLTDDRSATHYEIETWIPVQFLRKVMP